MSRLSVADLLPFIRMALHASRAEEIAPGEIVDRGEFSGPIDGWLPPQAWLARHTGQGASE
ncbi:hypothetical protein [Nocardia sp. NBC_01327]|uniref:hypothetical protein n=1 Tax=Nocardia sp. NBC_01327 TaxID=2903593 RepID=UPI002E0F94ED|nr:hypothetical protein OG326_24005 [Nocardia sp. NBC_01327]